MRVHGFVFFLSVFLLLLSVFFLSLLINLLLTLYAEDLYNLIEFQRVFRAIKLSVLTAFVSSSLAILVSVPTAYLLARYRFPGIAVIDTLLDLPLVLSPIALGALLLIFLNSSVGQSIQMVTGSIVFSVKGIVLAQFVVIVGLSVRLMKAVFEGIDEDFEHLARTLGAGPLQVFFSVTLPLAKNGLFASFILVWARAVGEFGATLMVAGVIPYKTETLPVSIYLGFEGANTEIALLNIAILTFLSLCILYIIRKLRFRAYV